MSPSGSSRASLASIGDTGGITGRSTFGDPTGPAPPSGDMAAWPRSRSRPRGWRRCAGAGPSASSSSSGTGSASRQLGHSSTVPGMLGRSSRARASSRLARKQQAGRRRRSSYTRATTSGAGVVGSEPVRLISLACSSATASSFGSRSSRRWAARSEPRGDARHGRQVMGADGAQGRGRPGRRRDRPRTTTPCTTDVAPGQFAGAPPPRRSPGPRRRPRRRPDGPPGPRCRADRRRDSGRRPLRRGWPRPGTQYRRNSPMTWSSRSPPP